MPVQTDTDVPLLEDLSQASPHGQPTTAARDLEVAAPDGSPYTLVPTALVSATSVHDVIRLFRLARRRQMPLTFRSAGTSTAGQASTDGLLVEAAKSMQQVDVLARGDYVRCQPGAILETVNATLEPLGRRIGPDPLSANCCTIGGVVANNATGMTCGHRYTAYRTLHSMVVVLPSGTVLDTASSAFDSRLRRLEPELHAGLLRLREQVTHDPLTRAAIAGHYGCKNTVGYSLNALTDYSSTADMLAHLMIGSEGTLGFIASVTLRTLPRARHLATALLVFDSLADAADAAADVRVAAPRAVELLPQSGLSALRTEPTLARSLADVDPRHSAALLIALGADSAEELSEHLSALRRAIPTMRLSTRPIVRRDRQAQHQLWALHRSMLVGIVANRPRGTQTMSAEVVLPLPALGRGCFQLAALATQFGFEDAAIFGHAQDGNLHCSIPVDLDDPYQAERYRDFRHKLADMVLDFGGSLSGEDGTGRLLTPLVERQYGPVLYGLMRQIKDLFDPDDVLNPGVILPGRRRTGAAF